MRALALHLPQFHPIPENDEWWGKGFTEWTNVARARPYVRGHYQPHVPADLGFYDLRLPETRAAQAEMAQRYGIDGFVYYHYWFTGRQVLERPVREVLESCAPDFPFCLCWANEDWTRAWDGYSGQRLLHQDYSAEDDLAHIRHLMPYFADKRYVRVDGRPLFLIYRSESIPEPQRTAERWRNEAVRAGVGDLYLARVESFKTDVDPVSIGFDAAVEFAPDWRKSKPRVFGRMHRLAAKLGLFEQGWLDHRWSDYNDLVESMLAKPPVPYHRYRCVTPGFDNSARRKKDATVFLNSTPARYGDWLERTIKNELARGLPADQQLVFVNAWNEWAEGNHLEPDQHWGHAYLQSHLDALQRCGLGRQP